mmetsp:Transcript_13287/g.28832  ORF Transcript_13287/g.28832 Transcript_13287/m.28832 type:complete len:119 (-) Transcript_13287:1765-2121(-)
MEGTAPQILNQWFSRYTRTVINTTVSPDLVDQGQQSLHIAEGAKFFLFSPIAPTSEPIQAGDTLLISVRVRIDTPGQIFQIYTGQYRRQDSLSIPALTSSINTEGTHQPPDTSPRIPS